MKRECFDQRLVGEVVLSAHYITVLGINVADARAVDLVVGSCAAQKAELRS